MASLRMSRSDVGSCVRGTPPGGDGFIGGYPASGCASGAAFAKTGSVSSCAQIERSVGYGAMSHLKRRALYICGTMHRSASVKETTKICRPCHVERFGAL